MFQRLHGLSCHPDITRFEIEDGLVRHAAASLLREATTISSIVLDVSVHQRTGLPQSEADLPLLGYNALMAISAEDDEATSPSNLADLLAETAIVGASALFATSNVAELEKPWIGSATPGPKITAFFDASAGGDSADYRGKITEVAQLMCNDIGDVGCRITHSEGDAALFSTAISFWFAGPKAADDAVESGVFDRLTNSDLVDSNSLVCLESVEHRILPNPNTWTTTTGVEPPTSD